MSYQARLTAATSETGVPTSRKRYLAWIASDDSLLVGVPVTDFFGSPVLDEFRQAVEPVVAAEPHGLVFLSEVATALDAAGSSLPARCPAWMEALEQMEFLVHHGHTPDAFTGLPSAKATLVIGASIRRGASLNLAGEVLSFDRLAAVRQIIRKTVIKESFV